MQLDDVHWPLAGKKNQAVVHEEKSTFPGPWVPKILHRTLVYYKEDSAPLPGFFFFSLFLSLQEMQRHFPRDFCERPSKQHQSGENNDRGTSLSQPDPLTGTERNTPVACFWPHNNDIFLTKKLLSTKLSFLLLIPKAFLWDKNSRARVDPTPAILRTI